MYIHFSFIKRKQKTQFQFEHKFEQYNAYNLLLIYTAVSRAVHAKKGKYCVYFYLVTYKLQVVRDI